MSLRVLSAVGCCLMAAGTLVGLRAPDANNFAPATEMPADRAADSYAIYRQVLPSDAIEWSDVQRTQWLLEYVTTARPLSMACNTSAMTDLPKAVAPPTERKAEWQEVLEDYSAHCHDRYQLKPDGFRLALPLHLLDEEEQSRYRKGVGFMPVKGIMQAPPTPDEFKGAAGLHSFSAVYFNREHTLAATYFGMQCGSLCGNWTWVVLEKRSNGWERLPWITVRTMS